MSRPGRPFRRRPLVIAHRGASGELPENTLPAFERAVEQQADMIEVDLHTTRDGEVVIRHDAELESLGGAGEIGGATVAEVRPVRFWTLPDTAPLMAAHRGWLVF